MFSHIPPARRGTGLLGGTQLAALQQSRLCPGQTRPVGPTPKTSAILRTNLQLPQRKRLTIHDSSPLFSLLRKNDTPHP